VLAGRLAAAPAGQILPPQLEERERVGWDEGVGEAVAQNAVIQNARAVKGRMSGMTEKELAELVQPRTTRSQTAAAAAAAPAECPKKKKTLKRQRKDSSSEGSSSEDSEEGSEEEGSDAEGSEEGGNEERDGEEDGDDT